MIGLRAVGLNLSESVQLAWTTGLLLGDADDCARASVAAAQMINAAASIAVFGVRRARTERSL
jgi:hypothetical protein